jgi:hypothetical protein
MPPTCKTRTENSLLACKPHASCIVPAVMLTPTSRYTEYSRKFLGSQMEFEPALARESLPTRPHSPAMQGRQPTTKATATSLWWALLVSITRLRRLEQIPIDVKKKRSRQQAFAASAHFQLNPCQNCHSKRTVHARHS